MISNSDIENPYTLDNRAKISVIIPAFNEAEGIKGVLDKMIRAEFHTTYEIIVVDDGSTDETASVVKAYPVRLIRHSVNKGYGASLKTGIRNASGEFVIMMDSDGQHDPEYLPAIVNLLGDHEMVIGTRTAGSHKGRSRQAGKKIIRWIGEYLVEQKLPD